MQVSEVEDDLALSRSRGGGRVRRGRPGRRENLADGDQEATLTGQFRGESESLAPVWFPAVTAEREAYAALGTGEVREGQHRGRVTGDRDEVVERARPGYVEGKVDRPETAVRAARPGP